MRIGSVLRTRLRSLFLRERGESELHEELQFHLERETERLQESGMQRDAARLEARRTFGALERTKEACRDARGTALVDAAWRDIRYTWRSFRRAPLAAVTIVATVGLGLGLVAVAFTILNAVLFRVDEVRDPYGLFGIERQQATDAEPGTFSRDEYDALVSETGIFSAAFATTSDIETWIDGSRKEGHLVTGNFFQVLGVTAARGRVFTPSDDEPAQAAVVVLSHRAWTLHFAGDPGIVNRTIRMNGTAVTVIGVMPEGFRGLEVMVAPDFWAPLSLREQLGGGSTNRNASAGLHIVGRLAPGLSRTQALARLLVWDANRTAARSGGRATASLLLESRAGTAPQPASAMLVFLPLFFAFGLVLMIGCANVANLLLARGVARQREIGIRLAVGASRRRIVWQLLTESLVLALVSAALAFFISRLVLGSIVYAVTSTFPPDIGNLRLVVPPADWRVGLFLIAGAMVSTVFFALAPALRATRVELVRAIRGEVVTDVRPGRARDVLLVLQVAGSVLLLICAAIFLRSSSEAARLDPGIRTAGVMSVRILDEQGRAAILDSLRTDPSVDSIAASWPGLAGGLGSLPAFAALPSGRSPVTYQFVSPEYFGLFGIDLVRGRGFVDAERTADTAVAVVSETVARQLWPGSDPLGQVLRVEPNPPSEMRKTGDPLLVARTVEVVGVARDVAGFRLGGSRLGGAGFYLPIGAGTAETSLTIRVRGDAERARHALVDRLAAIDPNASEVSTIETIARTEVYLLGVSFWLTLTVGALALLLTISGLFSLLSYLVEQRTREIGVRVALGATSGSIATLVLSQSARPVALGMLVGGSLTAALGALLLATPAAAAIGSTVRLFDPVAYGASLAGIVAACICAALVPALRAARIDPVGALRHD